MANKSNNDKCINYYEITIEPTLVHMAIYHLAIYVATASLESTKIISSILLWSHHIVNIYITNKASKIMIITLIFMLRKLGRICEIRNLEYGTWNLNNSEICKMSSNVGGDFLYCRCLHVPLLLIHCEYHAAHQCNILMEHS